ncbi:MAG: hypothetical protein HC925_08715 [Coleofasciculaceae cyanobacterium SM2_3_26]|nr:hypothetical protein [Coleofasciculaceae cyanobacterium SM2_3_26]
MSRARRDRQAQRPSLKEESVESFAYLYLAVSYESDGVPVLKISPPQIMLQSWEGLSGKMCLRLLPLLFSAAAIACATQATAQPYTLGDRRR